MAKLCLGFLIAATVWANPDWDAALRLAEEGKNAEASAFFRKSAETAPSFESHYNLAVLAVRSENWGESVVHLLESAKRTISPFTAHQILASVSRIQNHLLIQDPVSRSTPALVKFLLPDRFLWSVLFLLFWGGLFCFSFASKRTALIVWALCLASFGAYEAKSNVRTFAVVSTPNGEALYVGHELSSALTTLPAGTLLVLGTEKAGAREVLAPFVGWVQSASLTFIN